MSLLPRLPLLALLTCTALPAVADEPRYNQVSLRSEVSLEVSHDRMQVTLYTEAQDSDPARLAKKVTETLNGALNRARQVKEVTLHQGTRRSYPIYEEKGHKIRAWRERAELRLESADFTALSQLTGELLQTLNMGGMNFSISDEVRKRHEDELLREAVKSFGARARLTSEALGGTGYRLVNLNLHSSGFPQPALYRAPAKMAMEAASDAIAPQVEAGTTRISIQADGVIEVLMP